MKKIISIALVIVLAISVFAMAGCGNKPLKFGMGVVAGLGEAKNADGDTNGSGNFDVTAVAVLLDADNKIVAIDLDSADVKAAWTAEGKVVATEDFATKYEKGADYGMAAYGKKHDGSEGAVKEWFEQADAFEAACVGKTATEIAGLEAEGYGVEDVQKAGCTIGVTGFVNAVVNAAK